MALEQLQGSLNGLRTGSEHRCLSLNAKGNDTANPFFRVTFSPAAKGCLVASPETSGTRIADGQVLGPE